MKELLNLKASFKAATGLDWSPTVSVPAPPAAKEAPKGDSAQIDSKIKACGDKVRDLKAKKADKVKSLIKFYLKINW